MCRGCLEDWSWRLPGICGRSLNHRWHLLAFAAQKRWPRSWTTREMTSSKSGPRRQGKLCDKSTGSILVDGSWASFSYYNYHMSVCNLCILYTSIFILMSMADNCTLWSLWLLTASMLHDPMFRQPKHQRKTPSLMRPRQVLQPKNNTTVAIPSSCRITQDFDLQNFFHGLDKDQSQAQRNHYLQWFDSICWAV